MKYYGKITDPKDLVTKEYTDTKYTKLPTGIPKTDLASDVRESLSKADLLADVGKLGYTVIYNSSN